jgi:hypothetical protein
MKRSGNHCGEMVPNREPLMPTAAHKGSRSTGRHASSNSVFGMNSPIEPMIGFIAAQQIDG